MDEIRKTFAILKARWPEVTLIIGLYILGMVSTKFFNATRSDSALTWALLYLAFSLSVMIASTLLNYGFLRTVYLEGPKGQTPLALLQKGRHFFWRMVGFGLIYIIPYFILVWLIFLITKLFTSIDTNFLETARSFPFLFQFIIAVPGLILIKIILLMPALIIVLDCGVFESFGALRRCKLSNAKALIVLFLAEIALGLLWVFISKSGIIATTSSSILMWVQTIVSQLIGLMIGVAAVRFVASLNLVYDDRRASMDFEDLRMYSDRDLRQ